MTQKSGIIIATTVALFASLAPLSSIAQTAGAGGAAGGTGAAGGLGTGAGTGIGGLGTPTTSEPALRGPLQPSTGLSAPAGGAGTVGNPQMGTTGATPGPVPTLTPDQNLGGTPVGGTPESNAAASGMNALNPLASPTTTVGSGGVVNGLGSNAANQPLQVVVGAVDLSVGKTPVEVGPYLGVKVHVTNNTNSPLLLDGDRAALEKGGSTLTAVTNVNLEGAADPPEPTKTLVKNAVLAAVTVGANLAIADQKVENGPVLGRFGGDERRRESSAERFGKRIIWTGDSTEGVIFFPTTDVEALNGGNIKLPVCTFPGLDIRGYVTTAAGGLQAPMPPVDPLSKVGAPVKPGANDKIDGQDPTVYDTKREWPKHSAP